ncbi:MAG: DUF4339 domain-containing protein [Candidatus Nealsonbacteria bacterium]|nr:DUF4339 domain-containing protein [Candidatus Nealsonbacteria bacterium]
MSDPGNLKPNPDRPTPSPPPVHELADDGTFPLAEEVRPSPGEPSTDMPGGPPPLAEWYTGSPGGQREGPFTLAQMKQRLAVGTTTGETLVWKEGMTDWKPARGMGELFETPGNPPPPPPAAAARRNDFTEYFQAADRLFAKPAFFHIAGRVCALLAVLVLLVSLILWPFAPHLTWFTGAVLFALIFFVGEAAGAILDRLDGE